MDKSKPYSSDFGLEYHSTRFCTYYNFSHFSIISILLQILSTKKRVLILSCTKNQQYTAINMEQIIITKSMICTGSESFIYESPYGMLYFTISWKIGQFV